jgi:hypothetical protein
MTNRHLRRREFLSLALGGTALGLLAPSLARAFARRDSSLLIGAHDLRDGSHHCGWEGIANSHLQTLVTGFRGHGIAVDPGRPERVILFARRPGFRCCEVDLREDRVGRVIDAQPGRHYYGHGCFTPDGRYLLTSENDYASGRGVIGIYDSATLQHLGEWSSHGIGPHELLLMPGGRQLAVANGGIRTHPDSGRRKLNLSEMESSLTFLELETGDLLGRATLPDRFQSIRHLALGPGGEVAVAVQYQREAAGHERPVALVGIFREDERITPLDNPGEMAKLADYALSIAIDPIRATVGVTSPRGHTASFFDLRTGGLRHSLALRGVSGLAYVADRGLFALSTVSGELRFLDARDLTERTELRRRNRQVMWDNHLYSIARGRAI